LRRKREFLEEKEGIRKKDKIYGRKVCLVQEERVFFRIKKVFEGKRSRGLNRQEGTARFMNRKICVLSRQRGFPEMEERVS
jgi:hypothetical protein